MFYSYYFILYLLQLSRKHKLQPTVLPDAHTGLPERLNLQLLMAFIGFRYKDLIFVHGKPTIIKYSDEKEPCSSISHKIIEMVFIGDAYNRAFLSG